MKKSHRRQLKPLKAKTLRRKEMKNIQFINSLIRVTALFPKSVHARFGQREAFPLFTKEGLGEIFKKYRYHFEIIGLFYIHLSRFLCVSSCATALRIPLRLGTRIRLPWRTRSPLTRLTHALLENTAPLRAGHLAAGQRRLTFALDFSFTGGGAA